MNGLINLTFSGFPSGYCYPGDPDTFAADLLAATVVSFNTGTGNFYYNIGDTVPSVDNRVYPWYRTGTDDGFEGWYYWEASTPDGNAGWIQPYPCPASGKERRLWVGTTDELKTYDGGVDEAVDDCHGPFWEVDTDFAARIPMGPGTTANGTAITVGTNAGADEDSITMTAEMLVPHYHKINVEGDGLAGPSTETDGYLRVGAGTEVDWTEHTAGPKDEHGKTYSEIDDGSVTQEDIVVDTIGPVRGAYVIKRTARIYRYIV